MVLCIILKNNNIIYVAKSASGKYASLINPLHQTRLKEQAEVNSGVLIDQTEGEFSVVVRPVMDACTKEAIAVSVCVCVCV